MVSLYSNYVKWLDGFSVGTVDLSVSEFKGFSVSEGKGSKGPN